MRLTRRILVLFALSFAFLKLEPLQAQSVDTIEVAGFEGQGQEQSNWCWAASIQALFLTKGLAVDQESIVRAAYGRLVNLPAPGFSGVLRLLNSVVVDIDGDKWKVRAAAGPTYPNAQWLFNRFQKDEPVMIWFQDPNENHSIVLNGGTYYVNQLGAFMGWRTLAAYDPYFDREMTIDASNIPRYVYGTFEVEIRRLRQ